MSSPAAPLAKQPGKALLEVIESQKAKFKLRLPETMDADKFILGLATAVQKSVANSKPGKSLADCDATSVLLAAYEAAELGCILAPSLALGWLINYGNQAQFQPSYRFMVQKAYETGDVRTFFAEVVYASDKFERQYAPKKNLFHAPGGERTRVTAIGAYALIEFIDGTIDWEYMTSEQIDRHRKQSKQPNSMKWVDFWEEGWRITPIRVLAKRLPIKTRKLEVFIETVNKYADTELQIGNDAATDGVPTQPRRLSDRVSERIDEPGAQPAPAQTAAEVEPATATATETAQPTTQEQPAPAQSEKPASNGGQPSSMFSEADPYLSPAEVTSVWDKAFHVGWKKPEVTDFLKQNYRISAPKDLRKSQLANVLDAIQQAHE